MNGLFNGERNYFIYNLTRTKQDIKLPEEPRCVLPCNLSVYVVHFTQANSTILRQSVSWGHSVAQAAQRGLSEVEGKEREWGNRMIQRRMIGSQDLAIFSGRILHIPHKFFDCWGKYLPEHSEIIYPSINSINNLLGIVPKRIYYIGDTQRKKGSFIFSLLIHGQVERIKKEQNS